MATRTAAFAAGGGNPVSQTAATGVEDVENKHDIETPPESPELMGTAVGSDGLSRTDTRVSFDQPIGVTKIESLCTLRGPTLCSADSRHGIWQGMEAVLSLGVSLYAWVFPDASSIGLVAYVWSLAVITTAICEFVSYTPLTAQTQPSPHRSGASILSSA